MNLSGPVISASVAVYTLLAWACVWIVFLKGDLALSRGLEVSRKKNSEGNMTESIDVTRQPYPAHPRLRIYSTVLIASMFLFYSASFSGYSGVRIWSGSFENLETLYLPILIMSIVLIAGGAYLMAASRVALKRLYSKEIVFSLNPEHVTDGPYKYSNHPMYVGMVAILGGSFLIFPTVLGLAFALVICSAIAAKIKVENRE